jgi:hypothetical protein
MFAPVIVNLVKTWKTLTGMSFRLQSFTPTEHPSRCDYVLPQSCSRGSHNLFPLRGTHAHPLGFRPPLMCFCVIIKLRRVLLWSNALQGVNPIEPW